MSFIEQNKSMDVTITKQITNALWQVILFISVLLCACQSNAPLPTPSGKPEVMIQSSDRSIVKGNVINEFLNAGFTMEQESDNLIMFTKEMSQGSGIMYQALLGNANSSTPLWHVRVNLAPVGEQTRVIAQAFVRMQNAFGKEDSQDMTNGKSGQQLMEILSKIKTESENK